MNKNIFQLYPQLEDELRACCKELISNFSVTQHNYKYSDLLRSILKVSAIDLDNINIIFVTKVVTELNKLNIEHVYPSEAYLFLDESSSILDLDTSLNDPFDSFVDKIAEKIKQNYLNYLTETLLP